MDATCAPGDISYPNDLGILNQARRQTEKIIDSLYKSCQTKGGKKPRTYRKKARKDYLKVAKKFVHLDKKDVMLSPNNYNILKEISPT